METRVSALLLRFDERRGIICRMLDFIFAEALGLEF